MTGPFDEEALLDRFRRWLQDAHAEAEAEDQPPPTGDDDGFGLYRLVEEFTALRHEVKLQTKGSRGLQEQAETLLTALRGAIEHFRSVEPREAYAVWAAGKPLAEALADLDEALERGRSEIEKARRRLVDEPAAELVEALDASFAGQSWFRRRRTRSYHEAAREVIRRHGPEARRPFFDALLEGYGLIQTRLRRGMDAGQLFGIEALGQPVDPALMTVVEVVDDPARPAVEVVDEIRKGYTWRGRVLRYAEVRASRSLSPAHDEQTESNQPGAQDMGV